MGVSSLDLGRSEMCGHFFIPVWAGLGTDEAVRRVRERDQALFSRGLLREVCGLKVTQKFGENRL